MWVRFFFGKQVNQRKFVYGVSPLVKSRNLIHMDQRFIDWVLECQCVCGIFLHFAVSFQYCHHQSHRVVGRCAVWRQASIFQQTDQHALNYVDLTSTKRFVMCLLRFCKRTIQMHRIPWTMNMHTTIIHLIHTQTCSMLILFRHIPNTGCINILAQLTYIYVLSLTTTLKTKIGLNVVCNNHCLTAQTRPYKYRHIRILDTLTKISHQSSRARVCSVQWKWYLRSLKCKSIGRLPFQLKASIVY